jgi:hypothetical protein
MSEQLDAAYLEWLQDLVGPQEQGIQHDRLLKHLFEREFVMLVPNDDNRCADGLALRKEFVRSGRMRPTHHWMELGCSVLEMLVGVARHLSFTAEGEVGEWFWHLINNLGLARYSNSRYHRNRVDEIIERLVWRQYSYDGNGGLFPLQEPREDQRDVELWFQMESYILEMS